MSRADKTTTNAWYDIEIDPETVLPVKIEVTVLTGRKGATLSKGDKIVGGEHVAFHFSYALSKFDDVEQPTIPAEAGKVLAQLSR